MVVGNDRRPPHATDHVVVLHPTRSGWVQTWAGGASMLLLAVLATVFGRGVIAPLLFTILGGGALAWIAWDVPSRVEVGPDGVTRVCVLRRDHLPWGELVAIERHARRAPKREDGRKAPGDDTAAAKQRKGSRGGLTARGTGRRSWQLTDRAEGYRQYEALRRIMARHAPATLLRAGAPPQARRDSRPLRRRPTGR